MLTEYTDIMYEIFGDIYNGYTNCKFKVVPLESDEYLSDTVVDSAAEVYIYQRNIDRNYPILLFQFQLYNLEII